MKIDISDGNEGRLGMKTIIMLQTLALIIACSKWFTYKCATRGLLYYMMNEHRILISPDKAKELANAAMKRTVEEFLKQK